MIPAPPKPRGRERIIHTSPRSEYRREGRPPLRGERVSTRYSRCAAQIDDRQSTMLRSSGVTHTLPTPRRVDEAATSAARRSMIPARITLRGLKTSHQSTYAARPRVNPAPPSPRGEADYLTPRCAA